MSTERELKTIQEEKLFDLIKLKQSDEKEREALLTLLIERAQSGMTAEEIDTVRERVARSRE